MNIEIILRRKFISLIWKIKGLKIEKIYKEFIERKFRSKNQWKEYQDKLIQEFVNHCYNYVPFYKD